MKKYKLSTSIIIGLAIFASFFSFANTNNVSANNEPLKVDAEATKENQQKNFSRNLNVITVTGVSENDLIHYTRKKGSQISNIKLRIFKDKVVLEDQKEVNANIASLRSQFKYNNQDKILIATIDEDIEQDQVYLGFVESTYANSHSLTKDKGIWVEISKMKEEIKNSKTAFKKLLENPEHKKLVEERLKGLTEALKGKIIPMYQEGILISNLSVYGTEKTDKKPLEVILEKDEDKKTIINSITYKNLLPNQKYTLKGQLYTIDLKGIKEDSNNPITKEFTSDITGNGTVELKFTDLILQAGKRYAIDVEATSINHFEYKEGTKQHIANPETSGDLSLTFTVKKQEIKQPQDQNDDPNIQNDQAPDSNKNQTEGKNKTDGSNKLENEKNKEEGKQQDLKNKKDENPNSKKENSNIAQPSNPNQNKNNLPNTQNEKPKTKKGSTTKIVVAVISSLVGVSAIALGSVYIYKKRK